MQPGEARGEYDPPAGEYFFYDDPRATLFSSYLAEELKHNGSELFAHWRQPIDKGEKRRLSNLIAATTLELFNVGHLEGGSEWENRDSQSNNYSNDPRVAQLEQALWPVLKHNYR